MGLGFGKQELELACLIAPKCQPGLIVTLDPQLWTTESG
jgi:hypothetical protein